MAVWLRYLFAFLLFAHGFIYIRVGGALPGTVKGWNGRPWLLSKAITGGALITLLRAVHVAAGIAIVACAIAIALNHPSWRTFAILGCAVGLVAFAIFWDGQTSLLFDEGAVGAVISLALLLTAILA
ncbi:MAG TPA: hypothetical protein PKK95_15400 [Vicinamibacterales bacterium]|nr:hypothetical protein [Acidobacteriota bacterium]HOC19653.1 hypothetical protein [Vicinamibacterales bacterium]